MHPEIREDGQSRVQVPDESILYIKASNSAEEAAFGSSVAMSKSGDVLFAGAYTDSTNGQGVDALPNASMAAFASGAVYVFEEKNGIWRESSFIKASNARSDSFFGYLVEANADGSLFVVAAPSEDSGFDGRRADLFLDSGAVYVFQQMVNQSWIEVAFLKAPNAKARHEFGKSLAMSGDGRTLVSCSPLESANSSGIRRNVPIDDDLIPKSGACYVFSSHQSSANWTFVAYLKAQYPFLDGQFGTGVSISSDGQLVCVSTPFDESNSTGINGEQAIRSQSMLQSGAVHLFRRSSDGTWIFEAFLKASDASRYAQFGWTCGVSGSGRMVAVGAGGRSTGGQPRSGAVYLFQQEDGNIWTEMAILESPVPEAYGDILPFLSLFFCLIFIGFSFCRYSFFGFKTRFSIDELSIFVSSEDDSSARGVHFGESHENLRDSFGKAPASGALHVFRRSNATSHAWFHEAYIKSSNTRPSQYFGRSFSMASGGCTLVAGSDDGGGTRGIDPENSADQETQSSPYSGAVYLFRNLCTRSNSAATSPNLETASPSPKKNTLDNPVAVVVGGVLIGLIPFVVGVILLLSVWLSKRREALKLASAPPPSESASKNAPRWRILVIRGVVLAMTIVGIAITAYAVYDYVDFRQSNQAVGTLLNRARAELDLSARQNDVDCTISDTSWFFNSLQEAPCACSIESGSGVWHCQSRSHTPLHDCHIDSSPLCKCSATVLLLDGRYESFWSCSKTNETISSRASSDLGLRVVPPGAFSKWASHPALNKLFGARPGADYEGFILLAGESGNSVATISGVLLASLMIEGVALILLGLFAVKSCLDKPSSRTPRLCCGIQVSTIVDLSFVLLGAVMFGTVLVLAFSMPVQNAPTLSIQRVDVHSSMRGISSSVVDDLRSNCTCPWAYFAQCSCSSAGRIELVGPLNLNVSDVTFDASVHVYGALIISARTTVLGSLTIEGAAVFDASFVVTGNVLCHSDVRGSIFSAAFVDEYSYRIGGDLTLTEGDLIPPETGPATLAAIEGRVTLLRGSLRLSDSSRLILPSVRYSDAVMDSDRGILHVQSGFEVPSVLDMKWLAPFPYQTWQQVESLLISSGGGLLWTNRSIHAVIDWRAVNVAQRFGICSTPGSRRFEVLVDQAAARTSYHPACMGSVVSLATERPNAQGSVSGLSFAPVIGPVDLQLSTLDFHFEHSTCFSNLAIFKRHLDWISTLDSVSFAESVWSICPRHLVRIDLIAQCISYHCNGSMLLSDQVAQEQAQGVQENVVQGVVFDAIATTLDLLGAIFEYVLIPMVALMGLRAMISRTTGGSQLKALSATQDSPDV